MSGVVAWLAIASVVVNIAGIVPYIRDILRGVTRPERAAWWVWLALLVIAFFAQLSAGATWSLLFTIAQMIGVGLTAVLSIPYGYGRFERKDMIALIAALLGLLLWRFINQPLAALLVVIGIDAIGYYLLIAKTWQSPGTETLVTWVLAALASALGVLSVASFNFTRLVYPAYVLVGDLSIVMVLIARRHAIKGQSASSHSS